ncbi:hypothetical protein [Paraglaciecola sp. T6c]|uniref:hypothetical protein n=1 Tax=Pseudoalteromonas atlantica (strain T6c / ATCC BAA-1087) TaxID=3042615 RepID=UPI0005A1AB0C|nr:hypothetical protein [Paraglaciecola sp. T6c]
MKIRTLLILLTISGLTACSYPYGYHAPAPDTCDGAPGCAASAIFSGVVKTKPREGQKCADMLGENKRECEAQVESIKRSIENAKKQS